VPRALIVVLLAVAMVPGVARASSLVEVPVDGPAAIATLERIGADVTHEVTEDGAQVVVHDEADAEALRSAGFVPRTLVEDLEAATARSARSAPLGRTHLPSERPHRYRVLSEYVNEMNELAAGHPGLVRKLDVGTSVQGRAITGLEIASNVNAEDDGRPVYAIFGLHHAREWPSGEVAIEFAHDLATGYGLDPEVTELLDDLRIIIVPVVNPDGFVQSRGNDAADLNGTSDHLKRKNCEAATCAIADGVDLNRNYSAGWGGSDDNLSGSSDAASDVYRGSEPFSEPESQAIHALSQRYQLTNVQSIHNYGAQILRPPGFEDFGAQAPDEAGLKALGDAMAAPTLYSSEYGYDLYPVYGAAEDWNYASQGAFGYTIELGPSNGTLFHGNYDTYVVDQYLGNDGTGELEGVRWALLLAADQAADAAEHSVLTGDAEPGTRLRLRRDFRTETLCRGGAPLCGGDATAAILELDDYVETTMKVPASGRFTWHVGPSTRPWVAKDGGSEAWTFECLRADGTVLAQRAVTVGRGQTATITGCEPPKKQDPPVVQQMGEQVIVQTSPPQTSTTVPPVVVGSGPNAAKPSLWADDVRIRRLTLLRRRSVTLRLGALNGTLRALSVKLRDARGRTVAQRSVSRLAGEDSVRLAVRRALRRGTYRLTVAGLTASGDLVRTTARVTVR
jgi:carboxypeptidase T